MRSADRDGTSGAAGQNDRKDPKASLQNATCQTQTGAEKSGQERTGAHTVSPSIYSGPVGLVREAPQKQVLARARVSATGIISLQSLNYFTKVYIYKLPLFSTTWLGTNKKYIRVRKNCALRMRMRIIGKAESCGHVLIYL